MNTFKKVIIVIVIIGAIFGGLTLVFSMKNKGESTEIVKTERSNTDYTSTKRVYDEADILTDKEEAELQAYIEEKQKEVCEDIVVLLIDDLDVQDSDLLKEYAQKWYKKTGIGWNEANGDGVLYVDNWAEGADKKYTRMVTKGVAKENLDQDEIDDIIDDTCENVNNDPLDSYKTFVDETVEDLKASSDHGIHIPWFIAAIVALIAAVGFIIYQVISNAGTDTTSSETYTKANSFRMKNKHDIFLHSHVTKTKIEHNDSSSDGGDYGGGGGSH